jgi:membrane protease YdiL (CAAX protease family)
MNPTTSPKSPYRFLPHANISFRVALWAVITGMAVALPAAYLALLMPVPLPDPDALAERTRHVVAMSPWGWLLNAVIVSPLLEEVIFRGILLQLFRRYLPLWFAVLIATSLFAFGHIGISLQNVFAAFLIGLFLTWLFVRSDSLYPGILAHAGANLFWSFGQSDDSAHSGRVSHSPHCMRESVSRRIRPGDAAGPRSLIPEDAFATRGVLSACRPVTKSDSPNPTGITWV